MTADLFVELRRAASAARCLERSAGSGKQAGCETDATVMLGRRWMPVYATVLHGRFLETFKNPVLPRRLS
jgi:hypothetical protein